MALTTRPTSGTLAPAFALPGMRLVDGEVTTATYSLEAREPGPLVLVFYPGDDTPVCTTQLCSYSSGLEGFAELGAQVWGLSAQDLASHEAFARKHALRLPLLTDTGREVARAYGLLRLGGRHTARSVFVLDADNVVRWSDVRSVGLTWQRDADLLAAVRSVS